MHFTNLSTVATLLLLAGCAAQAPIPAGEARWDFADPAQRLAAYRAAVPELAAPIPAESRDEWDRECRNMTGRPESRSVALNTNRGLICADVPLPEWKALIACTQLGYAEGVSEGTVVVCRGPVPGQRPSRPVAPQAMGRGA